MEKNNTTRQLNDICFLCSFFGICSYTGLSLFFFFILGNIADLITTYYMIVGGHEETNLIYKYYFGYDKLGLFLYLKFAFGFIFYSITNYFSEDVKNNVLFFSGALFWVFAIFNIFIIF